MSNFDCIGKDGQTRTFTYRMSRSNSLDESELSFYVTRVDPPPTTEDFFELTLREVAPSTFQVVQINHHSQTDYIGAGIPATLLPLVANMLDAQIRSSSNANGQSEYRTPQADKMWRRLVDAGQATYDAVPDIYWLTPGAADDNSEE